MRDADVVRPTAAIQIHEYGRDVVDLATDTAAHWRQIETDTWGQQSKEDPVEALDAIWHVLKDTVGDARGFSTSMADSTAAAKGQRWIGPQRHRGWMGLHAAANGQRGGTVYPRDEKFWLRGLDKPRHHGRAV